jgi:hypothetical protein
MLSITLEPAPTTMEPREGLSEAEESEAAPPRRSPSLPLEAPAAAESEPTAAAESRETRRCRAAA